MVKHAVQCLYSFGCCRSLTAALKTSRLVETSTLAGRTSHWTTGQLFKGLPARLVLINDLTLTVPAGPDLEGGGALGLVSPSPRHHAKNILLSHILHKIKKKKCVSLAQLLLPGVNNGHDSCCYLNHLL